MAWASGDLGLGRLVTRVSSDDRAAEEANDRTREEAEPTRRRARGLALAFERLNTADLNGTRLNVTVDAAGDTPAELTLLLSLLLTCTIATAVCRCSCSSCSYGSTALTESSTESWGASRVRARRTCPLCRSQRYLT